MAHGIGTIHVRSQRGKLAVQAFGSTPRGTQFIRKQVLLPDRKLPPEELKREIAAAVTELMAESDRGA